MRLIPCCRFGCFPFVSSAAVDVYEEIRRCPRVELPDCSGILAVALGRMLAVNPKTRPSAGELLDLLRGGKGIGNSSVAEIEEKFYRECM